MDVTERKEAEEQRDLLVAELSHRVKNTLATVISIAQQSFSKIRPWRTRAPPSARASRRSGRRMAASPRPAGQASRSRRFCSTNSRPIVASDSPNVRVSGPPVSLNPKQALTLGMAIHELMTNAAKHGALSREGGSVDVAWEVDAGESRDPLEGDRRSASRQRRAEAASAGCCSSARLPRTSSGKVRLDFAETGLQCDIVVPLCDARV